MGTDAVAGKSTAPRNDKQGTFVFQAILLQDFILYGGVFGI
jgi:hypothetical protein